MSPAMADIDTLRAQAANCTRCGLYRDATTTVFGEGSSNARLVAVGEQPGDQEDLSGHPFVGPAGLLLARALEAAGIDRESVYLTNAVKHFKWTPWGRRRLHQSPSTTEVAACNPWLEAELNVIAPELVVALGATAGKALLGPSYRVSAQRAKVLVGTAGSWSGRVLGTVHPSAVIRSPDERRREEAFEELVGDLRLAVLALG